MSPKPKNNTERISTFLTQEQLEKLKEEAKRKGLTVSALIRLAVLDYIEKQRK